ncbi:MAG TPA: element excision factor XisH family protein [Gemmataceae bacterium]|nr:element excision factor XisH family protein [Gemmataceae bacterium]
MPAKNIYHDVVIHALAADGWTITHDPLTISFGGRDLYVDLGAERPTIGAEKGEQRIAVEVQSFLNPSPVRDLQEAVGQYDIYRAILAENRSDRLLYLAVPLRIYEGLLTERFGQLIIRSLDLRVLVFDHQKERVVQWIN